MRRSRCLLLLGVLASCAVGGCRDDKKPEAPDAAPAAPTPFGMAVAAKLTPTTNAVEILVNLHHPAGIHLAGDRMFLTDSLVEQLDKTIPVIREILEVPLVTGGAPTRLFPPLSNVEGLTRVGDTLFWLLAPSEEDPDHTRIAMAKRDAPWKTIATTYDIDDGPMVADGAHVFLFAKTKEDARSDVHRIDASGKLVRVASVGPRLLMTALAVNGTDVFWAEDGAIVRAPKGAASGARADAGAPRGTLVAKLPSTRVQRLVADEAAVYWTDSGNGDSEWNGRVYRAPLAGGPLETISDVPYPDSIAVDEDTVFWTSNTPHGGRVLARKKAGGPTYVLARELRGPTSLAVDAKHVYWLDAAEGAVCRTDKVPHLAP